MPAQEYGGLLGSVDGVDIRDWEASLKADIGGYSHAQLVGATGRRSGIKDWSGSYSCYGHTPPKTPGSTFTFAGSIEGNKGITGPAIVDEVTIKWDLEGGKIIENTTKFSGNGAPTLGSVSIAANTDIPVQYPSVGCKIQQGAVETPSYAEIPYMRTMELTIKCANKEFADAGTSGWKKRRQGPMDATLSASFYTDCDLSSLPALNTTKGLRLFVDSTTYWELLWMIVTDINNVKIDRETAAIVGCTINWGFDGIADQTTPALGNITTPDDTDLWP